MAIYHFSAQVASRSAGRSAVAMAAYRSGERLTDERTGELKHYKRMAQPETVILAPAQSPQWVWDRNRLWNEVELAEKRKDAQLCREINLALPKEFSAKLQMEQIKDYCQREFVDRGMVADIAIHRDNPENPHAHIMLTTREIGPEGFGKKNREWNDRGLLEHWREQWAAQVNRVFEANNRPERVDHRSFERQGIEDRLPTIHEGPTVREMEQRGMNTDRGSINRTIRAHNAMVVDLHAYSQEREKIKAEMESQKAPRSAEQLKAEYSKLSLKKQDIAVAIDKLENKLYQLETIHRLGKELEALRSEQERLRPKGFWQRLTKANQEKINRLEVDVFYIEGQMRDKQRTAPATSDVPGIQEKLSKLQAVFTALDRALEKVRGQIQEQREQERQQMLQKEKQLRRTRKRRRER